MNKPINIIVIILGAYLLIWGANQIYDNYVHEYKAVYIMKTGNENISQEVLSSHKEQAFIELVAHLGFVIFGVLLIVSPLLIRRKTHNKAIKKDV